MIHNTAYDVTTFLEDHPGGESVILKMAGMDATDMYDAVHSLDLLEKFQSNV